MNKVSEVDVADIDNLKVKQVMDGRELTLLMGNQKFSERMQNLLDNYSSIKERLGDATTLDLRQRRTITAAGTVPVATLQKR